MKRITQCGDVLGGRAAAASEDGDACFEKLGNKLDKLLERGLAQGREKQAGRRNVTGDKGLAVGSLLRQRGQAAVIVCRLIKNAVLF